MDNIREGAVPALGRLLMSVIFILGGYGKLMAHDGTLAYIAHGGLPFPDLAYWVSVLVELGGGLLILFGFQTRLVALALAVWCIVTGVIFHFVPADQGMMIHFMKNMCMAGGFLQLVAFGAGYWSLDAMISGRRRLAVA